MQGESKGKTNDTAVQKLYNNLEGKNKNLGSVQSQKIIDSDIKYKDSLLMMIDAQSN